MTEASHDNAAVLAVLAKDFTDHRFPRLLDLKEKVDNGNVLDDQEFEYLAKVLEEAARAMPLAVNNPEWHRLSAQVAKFFHTITEKALENEENLRSR
ncbi:MAG: hypothetical protein KDJ39_18430 [Gammaproteobacteria bacterium]|nr:hypothetical protein [Gammaproteobacteria bacterium]MCP5299446.1 hypothetical protein [Chromatiaceae bacterium]